MKKLLLILSLILCMCFAPGCVILAANPPSNYYVDESKLPFDALPGTDTTRYWGVHGGAGYQIEVPNNWNGSLVLYCHGYAGYGAELTVSMPTRIRPYLIANGFAWAASSYSKNGYDPAAGVKDTHDLTTLFNGLVKKPKRTYIIGHSMGGHIVGIAIEQYPKAYDAAMPMCGVMGDNELFDYFLDYHVVANWLAGKSVNYPFPVEYTDAAAMWEFKKLFGTPVANLPVLLNLTDIGKKLRTSTKYFSGGERPLFTQAFQYWGGFLFDQGLSPDLGGIAAGNVAGNTLSVYQLDDNLANYSPEEVKLNEEVLRAPPDRQGRHPNGIAGIPAISGKIGIPVLTLHTIGDLFVPFLMEQVYAQRVAAQGKSNLLVQRVVRDVGHCGFTAAEETAAFADLVKWVENGVKPVGDNVLDPAVVSNPKYGCQFTPAQHATDTTSPWACAP